MFVLLGKNIVGKPDVFGMADPCDFCKILLEVNLRFLLLQMARNPDIPAPDGDDPVLKQQIFPFIGKKVHGVGVGQAGSPGVKNDLHRERTQGFGNGHIGPVPPAGQRQGAIEDDLIPIRLRRLGKEVLAGPFRTHGMRAGGASADLVKFSYGFHCRFPLFILTGTLQK